MKKFLSLFCAVMIVFSASAAPLQKVAKSDLKTAKKELKANRNVLGLTKAMPVKKQAVKAPKAKKDLTFTLATDELQAFSAKIIVTPSDDQATYYWGVMEKAQSDTLPDAALASSVKSSLDYYIMMYQYLYGVEYTYADFLSQGEEAYTFSDLEAETVYTIYAMQMDEEANLIGAVTRQNFTTPSFAPTGDTVRVAISGLKFDDYVADQGWWQIVGYSADSTYYVSFSNADGLDITEPAGNYDYETQMDPDYSVLYIGDEKIVFVSGSVVVSQNQDGTYHVYADVLAKDGKVYIITLDSKLVVPSDNTITMSYNNGVLSINTTNSDTYFYYIETKEEYDEYESDFSQASINEEADAWIATLKQYGYMSYFTVSGNYTINVSEFLGQYNAEGEYVALAAPVDDGDRNGEAVYLLFTHAWPEAIDNTAVEIKATKAIRNGQLLIIKNGVEYNAQGAVVK